MEPLSTSTPVTVPIVAACREVSTTVSVRRASRERRRRQAKGWRSTSVSRRPGFARASCSVSRASCSVSRSSTSAGGKGACLNGAAAAAAAMHTALASIDGRENLQREEGSGRLPSGNICPEIDTCRACPYKYSHSLLRPRATARALPKYPHSTAPPPPRPPASRMLRAGCRRRPRRRRARVLPRATGRRRRLRSRRASRAMRSRERSSRAACVSRAPVLHPARD